jgi:hypothetical protein
VGISPEDLSIPAETTCKSGVSRVPVRDQRMRDPGIAVIIQVTMVLLFTQVKMTKGEPPDFYPGLVMLRNSTAKRCLVGIIISVICVPLSFIG